MCVTVWHELVQQTAWQLMFFDACAVCCNISHISSIEAKVERYTAGFVSVMITRNCELIAFCSQRTEGWLTAAQRTSNAESHRITLNEL